MQIVIDIDEEDYNFIQEVDESNYSVTTNLYKAVYEGIILPKGHGRLIDADAFIAKVNKDRAHSCYIESWTADDVLDRLQQNYAPTIIEADKMESEDKE